MTIVYLTPPNFCLSCIMNIEILGVKEKLWKSSFEEWPTICILIFQS